MHGGVEACPHLPTVVVHTLPSAFTGYGCSIQTRKTSLAENNLQSKGKGVAPSSTPAVLPFLLPLFTLFQEQQDTSLARLSPRMACDLQVLAHWESELARCEQELALARLGPAQCETDVEPQGRVLMVGCVKAQLNVSHLSLCLRSRTTGEAGKPSTRSAVPRSRGSP